MTENELNTIGLICNTVDCVVVIGQGVAVIDNKLFVVFDLSSNIEVYDAQTLNHLSNIEVKGLLEPQDIVACHEEHQLYVADKENE